MNTKRLLIASALLVFFFVIELIRRQKMTFKYSLFWLVSCVTVLFFTWHDKLLAAMSEWAGFMLPSNFVFFLLLVFFILLSLFLTLYVNEENNRSETLAQAIARLEFKLNKLDRELRAKDPRSGA